MVMNELDQAGETYTADNRAGRLPGGTIGMLVGIAIASGLGFVAGMLLGRKQGETRGLAVGLELGRAEAVAAMDIPRTSRRLWWRRAAA